MALRKNKKERGQISVLIGVMMMTFMLFFAFVINTGMLVNARINIQNAADLAAYAGAAVQARQLTHISYLNYEMRRYWKKFLFRIYVIGNMAHPSFVNMRSSGPPLYVKYLSRRPVTCVIFDPTDNYCQVDSIPPLEGPPESIGNLDAMTNALRATMKTLNDIQIQKCMALASANQMLNSLWLLNSDPKLSFLNDLPPEVRVMANKIAGVATGLGLIPKEILLRARIKTLESYVNSAPRRGVSLDQAKALLSSSNDPASVERTLQAFYSAYYTLGNFTFSANEIELTELMNPELLKLKDVNTGPFLVYAMGRALSTEGSQSGTAHCVNKDVPMRVDSGVVVGVSKDPSLLTYYAVRLKAKARLLFNPLGSQGNLQLKAYAAARPFGSRIGPPSDRVSFTHTLLNGGPIPNAAIFESEELLKEATGFDNYSVLGPLCLALNGCSGSTSLRFTDILNGYSVSMAPNPWEENKYNIINDLGNADGFVRNFGEDDFANLWAPVVPLGSSPQEVQETIRQQVTEIFSPSVVHTSQEYDAKAPLNRALLVQIITKLQQYVQQLRSPGGGEDGETLNVARISNPYRRLYPSGTLLDYPSSVVTQNRSAISTSWNDVKDSILENLGRVGYSIKFVTFSSLNNRTITTSNWSDSGFMNGLLLDSEAQADIPALEH